MNKKKLTIGTNTVEDVTFVKISGVIDEDNDFPKATKRLTGKMVVLDLAEVRRINSCGVRDWVNWLTELDAQGKEIVLTRCSPPIVTQLNLVNNFIGRAKVKSFFAPYYCEGCDLEVQCLLQVEDFAGQPHPRAPKAGDPKTPSVRCQKEPPKPGCGLEFDDIEAAYFSFLPRNTGQIVDEALIKRLASLSPDLRARIERLDKVSSDTGTPISGTYSPLTATSISIARDSLNVTPEAEVAPTPPPPGRSLNLLLTAAALGLVGLLAYVVFVMGQK